MTALRSLAFNATFYLWTTLILFAGLPLLPLSYQATYSNETTLPQPYNRLQNPICFKEKRNASQWWRTPIATSWVGGALPCSEP